MIHDKNEVKKATLAYFDGDSLAADVWMSKYALRNKDGDCLELTPDDMFRRVAKEFARIEQKYPNPMSEEEILGLIRHFKFVVPQGGPLYGIANDFALMSLSNCVVVAPPKDSVSGIMDTGKDIANLYKYRCGVGFGLDSLRPNGMTVNNAAKTTTGAWSFADFYSHVTGMIGQAGRRGALMLSMGVKHPDIENFIDMKRVEGKVDNANVSIKLYDDFMHAVVDDRDYVLEWRGQMQRTVSARALFEKICKAACDEGEPGVLFWDRILDVPLQCYADMGFDHVGVNPCAELVLSAYDSCRLITINLSSFVFNGEFEMIVFADVVRKAQRLCDDLIDLEVEKLQKIIDASNEEDVKIVFKKLQDSALSGRRTGLGVFALGDMLLKMKLKYDSDEAIAFVDEMMYNFKNAAYWSSVEMAEERGAFPIWNWDKEKHNAFIELLDSSVREKMSKVGRRNGALLTISPTGSMAIEARTTSGIEPVFRLAYDRRKKLNPGDSEVPDYTDNDGTNWKHYSVYHPYVQQYMSENELNDVAQLPAYFVTSDQVDYRKRLEMQAACQRHIDHQISSTINLPRGTTWQVVRDIYLKAWQLGLKGITVYVDGSRDGVLLTKDEKAETKFVQCEAPARPDRLACEIHHLQVKSEKWTILVGILDGKPYEVFGGLSSKVQLPKKTDRGFVVKHARKTARSTYDLLIPVGEGELLIQDVVDVFDNPTNLSLCRMISLSLRQGAPVERVVEQLLRSDKEADMFTFCKGLARCLKKYIEDGTQAKGDICPECEGKLSYQGGCVQCDNCGWSKC